MADIGQLTVVFSASEGSIQNFSAVSRMGTFDIINDLSHEEAVKYCTCISHRLANNDVIVKLGSMVGGRFSDLKLACNMLRMMSLHQVAESMFHSVTQLRGLGIHVDNCHGNR